MPPPPSAGRGRGPGGPGGPGGSGGPGTTVLVGPAAAEVPPGPTATTVNVYAVPFVKFANVALVGGGVPVIVIEPWMAQPS